MTEAPTGHRSIYTLSCGCPDDRSPDWSSFYIHSELRMSRCQTPRLVIVLYTLWAEDVQMSEAPTGHRAIYTLSCGCPDDRSPDWSSFYIHSKLWMSRWQKPRLVIVLYTLWAEDVQMTEAPTGHRAIYTLSWGCPDVRSPDWSSFYIHPELWVSRCQKLWLVIELFTLWAVRTTILIRAPAWGFLKSSCQNPPQSLQCIWSIIMSTEV